MIKLFKYKKLYFEGYICEVSYFNFYTFSMHISLLEIHINLKKTALINLIQTFVSFFKNIVSEIYYVLHYKLSLCAYTLIRTCQIIAWILIRNYTVPVLRRKNM